VVFSDIARTWLPMIVAIDILIVLPGVAAATVMALIRRPSRAGWLGYAAALGVGLALGFFVLVTDARPALRVAILIAIAVVAASTGSPANMSGICGGSHDGWLRHSVRP
jgi:hypothetical protein